MTNALNLARNKYNIQSTGLAFNAERPIAENDLATREISFATTLELDVHHCHLLRSKDELEVVLGVRSIAFWASNGPDHLPRELYNVLASKSAKDIAQQLRSAFHHLEDGDYKGAMLKLNKLFFGGIVFGSALLAFADPENVGIFHDWSVAQLSEDYVADLLGADVDAAVMRPDEESMEQAVARFEHYCKALQAIQKAVNNTRTGWQDCSGCQMARYRSIDVQRALFILERQKRQYS